MTGDEAVVVMDESYGGAMGTSIERNYFCRHHKTRKIGAVAHPN
jgi:hypothetical protein